MGPMLPDHHPQGRLSVERGVTDAGARGDRREPSPYLPRLGGWLHPARFSSSAKRASRAATNLARLATLKVRSIPGKGWAVAG